MGLNVHSVKVREWTWAMTRSISIGLQMEVECTLAGVDQCKMQNMCKADFYANTVRKSTWGIEATRQ